MSVVSDLATVSEQVRMASADAPSEKIAPPRVRARHQRRSYLLPRSLMIADVAGLVAAYLLAAEIWRNGGAPLGSPRQLLLFTATLPAWILIAGLQGLYRHDHERAEHSTTEDVVGVFQLVTIGVWVLLAASRLVGRNDPDIVALMIFWALAVCLLPLSRTLARRACKRTAAFQQNTIIVGAGEVGQLVGRKLVKHPEYGANVVGFVDRNPRPRRGDLPEHLSVLGAPEDLPGIIKRFDVERVIVAFSAEPASELLQMLRPLNRLGVQIDFVPRLFELLGPQMVVHSVETLPLLGLPPAGAARASRALKRALDIVLSAAALIVLAPLFAYIAWCVKRDSSGPIFFRQARLGLDMKEFTALKFRTMFSDTDELAHRQYIADTMSASAEADANGLYKLDRSDCVTASGRWLRKTSLDELPQLINVLRGDMSLVGPRPCIPYEVENYEPHHLERFKVPQGITGLWQVTARANSTYGESLAMDVAYVRGWSLWLDVKLLLRTPLQVLRQRASTA